MSNFLNSLSVIILAVAMLVTGHRISDLSTRVEQMETRP